MVQSPFPSDPTHRGKKPNSWVVPYPRNEGFVGRESFVGELHKPLLERRAQSPSTVLCQVMHGLGGVGKTQLAVKYAHDFAAEDDRVAWIRAETPSTIALGFSDLADKFLLGQGQEPARLDEKSRALRDWLESPASGQWLLIFDNVNSQEDLRNYLPTRGAGHVLVTSRRTHWPGYFQTIELPVFERDESIRLLQRGPKQYDPVYADRLAEALGDLPLALAQAVSYIAQSGIAINLYLDLFKVRRSELLKRGDPPDDYQCTVFATLELAMSAIGSGDADGLLGILACLAPDSIPRFLLDRVFKDPLRLADALAAMGKYSLLKADEQAIHIHRLVQAVAFDRTPLERRNRVIELAVALLACEYPRDSNDVNRWDACRSLQPHADQSLSLAREHGIRLAEEAGGLLENVGIFNDCAGLFDIARRYLLDGLECFRSVFQTAHPDIFKCLVNLGVNASRRGVPREAKEYLDQALETIKNCTTFGPNDLLVAQCLVNSANAVLNLNRPDDAETFIIKAHTILDAIPGPHHEVRGAARVALGSIAFRRAVTVPPLPDEDPIARAHRALRMQIVSGQRVAEANIHYQAGIDHFVSAFGAESFDVATASVGLSKSLYVSGNFETAKIKLKGAIAFLRARVGDLHPTTVEAMKLLEGFEIMDRARGTSGPSMQPPDRDVAT
jgi:tetratricopeptide (TPR) repeat protein